MFSRLFEISIDEVNQISGGNCLCQCYHVGKGLSEMTDIENADICMNDICVSTGTHKIWFIGCS